MNKKLYVGNLSYDATEADLQALFGQFGTVVSVALITDKMSGRSKGFGFVEMETVEAAQQAIEKLNNFSFKDRNLTVNEARPQTDRPAGGRFNDRGGGGGWGGAGRRDNRGGGGGGGGQNRRTTRRSY